MGRLDITEINVKKFIIGALAELRSNFWQPGSLKHKKWWLRLCIPPMRTVYAIWTDWWSGELTLRAMSLVYTTLLSLVPLLAVSFSVLKAFGVHNQVEPLLLKALAPMGNQGVVITEKMLGFVDNMKVGVLGFLGLGMLFYTVVALMQKIEAAFNYTWHVTEHRSIGQRFSYYLSTIMIGPVLVFSAVGLSATVMDSDSVQQLLTVEPLGTLVTIAARFIPLLMIITAFTFLYVLLPNTNVNLRSAIVGALVAGVLWQSAGMLFTTLVVSSAQYTAVYSALASLIFFMIWLYVSWMILLVGASVAHYHQNPERLLTRVRDFTLSIRQQRIAAFALLKTIQNNFHQGIMAPSLRLLSKNLSLPEESLDPVINNLQQAQLILFSEKKEGWIPAQDFHNLNLSQILKRMDRVGESDILDLTNWQIPDEIYSWEKAYNSSLETTFENIGLCSLDTKSEQK
jgi:membrane protein